VLSLSAVTVALIVIRLLRLVDLSFGFAAGTIRSASSASCKQGPQSALSPAKSSVRHNNVSYGRSSERLGGVRSDAINPNIASALRRYSDWQAPSLAPEIS